jgi:hypothetical protein
MFFEAQTLGSVYQKLVTACLNGDKVSPRGKLCYEIRPAMLLTQQLTTLKGAGVNYRLATAEAMAWLCGWDDVDWLERFRPGFSQFSDDGVHLHGAYGKRMAAQLDHALTRLREDPDSRQVVINIWMAGDLVTKSKDLPCNTQLFLKIRKKALHMTVMVRSQDAIWGLPYDHFAWWFILRVLAADLNIYTGTLTHVWDSLHVYHPSAGFYNGDKVIKSLTCREDWEIPVINTGIRDNLGGTRSWLTDIRNRVEDGKPTTDELVKYLRKETSDE